MAMSFVRPDPSLPASVADASFSTGRRGFDQTEVRDFLRMVAAEMGRLQERERFLERELRTAQSNPDLSSVPLDEESLTRLLGEETARVLTTARESAAEIRQKAEQSAAQLLSEAGDESSRQREEAEIESSRRRTDAAADAEAELAMAKQQGREMVNEARAYRERVLSELARRRELAREQIEQLLHGRDRLMQSFERARLVAVDVVSELQPLGEPDEYVNLAPTTGPVPVMLPNAPRPVSSSDVTGRVRPVADPVVESHQDRSADIVIDEVEPAVATTDHVDVDPALASVSAEPSATDGAGDAVGTIELETGDGAADDGAAGGLVLVEGEIDEAENLEDVIVEDTTPEDTASEDTTPEDTASEDIAPEDATPEDATPEDVTPEDMSDIAPVDAVSADLGLVDAISETADADFEESDAPDESADVHVRDDVVVDLFARLRADTTSAASGTEASGTEVHDAEVHDAEKAGDGTADVADIGASSGDGPPSVDDSSVDDDGATPFTHRDTELTPLIVSSAKKLKRALADEQNGVLDALRRKESVRDIAVLLPEPDEHLARYGTAIADDLLAAVNAGASSAAATSPLGRVEAKEATLAAEAVLDEWLILPLRERLERCVNDGDGDNVGITRRVRAVYREWKTQHIDEQLDDAFRAAYGRGAFVALAPGAHMVWVVDDSRTACADCNDNTLAGAVRAGEAFPTGQQHAPAHPGCRCLLLPSDG